MKTNGLCINSDHGVGCVALEGIDSGCLAGTCPFYKTHYRYHVQAKAAQERCEKLGIPYRTRDDIIREMREEEQAQKPAKKKARRVIQHNTSGTAHITYPSIAAAATANGLTVERLRALITTHTEEDGKVYTWGA